MSNEKCCKGYSIWIMPERKVYNKLSNLIYDISKKYNSPFFEPHVTLIGDLSGDRDDLVAKCSELASSINVDKIKLNRIGGFFDNYFRSVFATAMKTPQIVDANFKARNIFNHGNLGNIYHINFGFMPHLSLAYGHFSPATKDAIVSDVKKEFNLASRDDSIINLSFDANNIYLYFTGGKVEDWRQIGGFSLK